MRWSVMSPHLSASLADVRGEVGGHGTELLSPCRPVIAAATAQIEVGVLAADISIVGIELRVGALGDIAVAGHRALVGRCTTARAVNPKPRIIIHQLLNVLVGRMPLPATQL